MGMVHLQWSYSTRITCVTKWRIRTLNVNQWCFYYALLKNHSEPRSECELCSGLWYLSLWTTQPDLPGSWESLWKVQLLGWHILPKGIPICVDLWRQYQSFSIHRLRKTFTLDFSSDHHITNVSSHPFPLQPLSILSCNGTWVEVSITANANQINDVNIQHFNLEKVGKKPSTYCGWGLYKY